MKQLLKRSMILAALLIATVVYSNEFTLSSNDKINIVTNVNFKNVSEGSLLLIKDGDGLILYKELIEKTGTYSKRFDLTNLPDADYYFELEKQTAIIITPFTVKGEVAEFDKEKEFKISKPKVVVNSDQVYVSKLLQDNQSVVIKVYYEGQELVHSENFKDAQYIKRVYNFSESMKGEYTIIISSEGKTFKNTFRL